MSWTATGGAVWTSGSFDLPAFTRLRCEDADSTVIVCGPEAGAGPLLSAVTAASLLPTAAAGARDRQEPIRKADDGWLCSRAAAAAA